MATSLFMAACMRGVQPLLSVSFTFVSVFFSSLRTRLTFLALAASESCIDIEREKEGGREEGGSEEGGDERDVEL